MPMTPFTWKSHILLNPSSISTIVFALDVPFEALQKKIEMKR
jgi:hypothetical protein